MTSVLRKRLLAATLGAASLMTGFTAASGIRSARCENFTGGSRTAEVATADFRIATRCSLTLYEDGKEQVKESHIRWFNDDAADVAKARADATTWVSAPEPEPRFDYPAPFF
jgi:hypothetical protein